MFTRDGPGARGPLAKEVGSKRVLLADDHKALRLLYARKIRAAGHELFTAADGAEALRLAQEHEPDLVVLDETMPIKDGYEVCQLIKRTPKLEGTPVILYSATETDEFIRRGTEAGADACLRKTSKSSELLAKIEELLLRHAG